MESEMAEPARQSFLLWFFSALGVRYTFLLPLAALLAFVLILVLVIRGRGWAAGAAVVLLVPLPFVVGILGTIDGIMMSYMVIAASDVRPKPAAVAEGVSTALVTALVGLLLMVPGYVLAVGGLLLRSFRDER
jgi:MotA/TolQ/ExbB proton channel family protein